MWEFRETTRTLTTAEQMAARGERAAAIATLRRMSLDQFGYLLWQMPNDRWPALSAILPSAPPKDVQLRWTGNSGDALLAQSFAFTRSMVSAYHQFVGADLSQQKVLDFGCGYGRLLRLMEHFVNLENLHGCDTWDESLAQCRQAGIGAQLSKSDAIPKQLPYPDDFFGLVYALSVFTHLPVPALKACLVAIRRCMRADGLLVATIRPVEYWTITGLPQPDKDRLSNQHERDGIAFYGGENYGDLSISVAKFAELADGWRLVATDWNHKDAHQHLVMLQPS